MIQINLDSSWVPDSPYIHVFDELDKVHHQIEEDVLIHALTEMEYQLIAQTENLLPNGKKLVQVDFEH